MVDSVSVRFKNARVEKMLLNIRIQWNVGTECVSECVLKTLACQVCVSALVRWALHKPHRNSALSCAKLMQNPPPPPPQAFGYKRSTLEEFMSTKHMLTCNKNSTQMSHVGVALQSSCVIEPLQNNKSELSENCWC